MSEQLEQQDPEDEEYDLLASSTISPRIFNLNNKSETTLLGVVMEETDDSFLVGLPSRLLEVNGELKVEIYIPTPFVRLMKASILSVSFLFGIFREKYWEFLQNEGQELFPELIAALQTPTYVGEVLELVDDDDDDVLEYEFDTVPGATEVVDGMPVEAQLEAPDEIDKRLEDIISKGGLVLTGSKTKQ